jgi:hypothetical protein
LVFWYHETWLGLFLLIGHKNNNKIQARATSCLLIINLKARNRKIKAGISGGTVHWRGFITVAARLLEVAVALWTHREPMAASQFAPLRAAAV